MALNASAPIVEHPLRQWRKAAGFTLEHCAGGVGTTRPVWHAWETGKRRPDAKFLPLVREFTGGAVGADAFFPSVDATKQRAA